MSLGFTGRDFVAVGAVVNDIISALRNARTEYNNLIRELECLQKALLHLDRLQCPKPSTNVDSIKYAALSCRKPLEDFLTKVRKYESSLGPQASSSNLGGRVLHKIKFAASYKSETQRLQTYLNVHVGTINLLLIEYGFEKMEVVNERNEDRQDRIREQLAENQGVLDRIKSSIACQTLVVTNSTLKLNQLYQIVSGELLTTWRGLENMIVKVCLSTQQIYALVVEIRTSVVNIPDNRWSHFQDPINVEDALGRKFPFPSEFEFTDLEAMIRHKFREGPGSKEVSLGDYEVMDSKNRSKILSAHSPFVPGSSIAMAILISKPPISDETVCPMPKCRSSTTRKAIGGGRHCCECNIWFDESEKLRTSLFDIWDAFSIREAAKEEIDMTNQEPNREEPNLKKRKREVDDQREEDGFSRFKNVRLADSIDGAVNLDLGERSSLSISNLQGNVHSDNEPVLDDALEFSYRIKAKLRELRRIREIGDLDTLSRTNGVVLQGGRHYGRTLGTIGRGCKCKNHHRSGFQF